MLRLHFSLTEHKPLQPPRQLGDVDIEMDQIWFRLFLSGPAGLSSPDKLQLIVCHSNRGGYNALVYGMENGAATMSYKYLSDLLQLSEHMVAVGCRHEHFEQVNKACEQYGLALRLPVPGTHLAHEAQEVLQRLRTGPAAQKAPRPE